MSTLLGTMGVGVFVAGMINHYAPDMQDQWFIMFGVQCAYFGIVEKLGK